MAAVILTGTPGSGKTTLLLALEGAGYPVVREAATDVIALGQARGVPEPWMQEGFAEQVMHLQIMREEKADSFSGPGPVWFDRSPVCTRVLALWLQKSAGGALSAALEKALEVWLSRFAGSRRVLFVENQGFCAPSEARRISFEDSLAFEALHREVYTALGFECISVPAGPLQDRLACVRGLLGDEAFFQPLSFSRGVRS
jgi:predicted ATPase